jgi:Domain of unknown function (DUF4124)
MRAISFVLLAILMVIPCAQAQIYVCVREDGSRIYSDTKCGPNAKVVKGFETTNKKKKSADKAKSAEKKVWEKKTPEQLAELLDQCNKGLKEACSEWTFGGGPNALREAESHAEKDCESGSLSACELRYCVDGATEQCRQSVLRSAELSGENWYLRKTTPAIEEGARTYGVRCIYKNNTSTKDLDINCVSNPSAQCSVAGVVASATGLRQAAGEACRVTQAK